jgi:hypothetical protein
MTEPHYFPDDPFGPSRLIEIEETLSLHEQFKLIEIAYETCDGEIRRAALKVLGKYLNPTMVVLPGVNQDGEAV